MTVEMFLTRKLDIRFIDARSITNEAKVNLGIHGYPTKEQELQIKKEACRIFCERPETSKDTMRHLRASLDAIRAPSTLSGCCSSSSESSDTCTVASSASVDSTSSTKRSFSLFRRGRY